MSTPAMITKPKVVAMENKPLASGSLGRGIPSTADSTISTNIQNGVVNYEQTRPTGEMEDERASVRAARRAPLARNAERRRAEQTGTGPLINSDGNGLDGANDRSSIRRSTWSTRS